MLLKYPGYDTSLKPVIETVGKKSIRCPKIKEVKWSVNGVSASRHVLVWAGNRDRAGGSGGVRESAVLGGKALPD